MSKPDVSPGSDKKVTDNVSDDSALRNVYAALKAEQPMPEELKQRILQQAKRSHSQRNWRSWGYFSQMALGVAALVLVLSWVNPATLPDVYQGYYQIETLSSAPASNRDSATVQWHHLTASAAPTDLPGAQQQLQTLRLQTLKAQQRQLQRAGELNIAMSRQIGLLTQHKDSWQIAMCDKMQLNVAMELVQELNTMLQIEPALQPQWVELQFAPTGHILAIAALPKANALQQCPAV
ncbi:MAG: hypothetical protein CML20_08735 [Rheinheimera sp.]|uniref:hypothetical protein n=1 Tax=Arsukibacterium sp. UBA3155 TaxID=1946058 RepID=UPI000C98E453|nr:hypothetical protein [Arsukibacterium sp. UBA3155]MAD74858.1 hypothetical protein [Rheinheimera sp.]|tara:strand:- start:92207 stop:92914 length:708 start_codon:yes stop_codon:yes gene_type:complete